MSPNGLRVCEALSEAKGLGEPKANRLSADPKRQIPKGFECERRFQILISKYYFFSADKGKYSKYFVSSNSSYSSGVRISTIPT